MSTAPDAARSTPRCPGSHRWAGGSKYRSTWGVGESGQVHEGVVTVSGPVRPAPRLVDPVASTSNALATNTARADARLRLSPLARLGPRTRQELQSRPELQLRPEPLTRTEIVLRAALLERSGFRADDVDMAQVFPRRFSASGRRAAMCITAATFIGPSLRQPCSTLDTAVCCDAACPPQVSRRENSSLRLTTRTSSLAALIGGEGYGSNGPGKLPVMDPMGEDQQVPGVTFTRTEH